MVALPPPFPRVFKLRISASNTVAFKGSHSMKVQQFDLIQKEIHPKHGFVSNKYILLRFVVQKSPGS